MTKDEALELLKSAPQSDSNPSRVNPSFTEKEAVDMIRAGLPEGDFSQHRWGHIFEKRVWQVVKNQRRPRY